MKILSSETQSKIKAGIDKLADIVKQTLGARGRNVIISDEYGRVQIINDGVSIASEIELEDPVENVGAILAKQCAQKTNTEAGDGTTTTIVLLQAYLEEMMKVKTDDPRKLREDIEQVLEYVIDEIDKSKRELKDEDIVKIARNASLDEEIAQAVYEIIKKVGKDGVIDIEELDKYGIETEVVQGLKIEDGFMFQGLGGEITDCDVLVTKKKIEDEYQIIEFLEPLIKANRRKIAIFAADIKHIVAGSLALNRAKGVIDVVLVKTNDLEDIATVTGAKMVSEESGQNIGIDALGHCDKVLTSPNYSLISGGNADIIKISEKLAELEKELKSVKPPNEKLRLEKRIARLKGGVSVIRIGGHNQQSMRERKLKLEDAIGAVKGAMEDGIVEGGGLCLYRIADKIDNSEMDGESPNLIFNVTISPALQIAKNANEVFHSSVDYWEQDIIDPAKVVKCALRNAIATGNMILTANNSIIYKPDGHNQTEKGS